MYACYGSINDSCQDHKSNIEGYCLNQQCQRLARNWLVSTCLFQMHHHPQYIYIYIYIYRRARTHTSIARLDNIAIIISTEKIIFK
jgi:hypothetical protein